MILPDAVHLPLSAVAVAVAFAAGGQRRKDDFSFFLHDLARNPAEAWSGAVLRPGGKSVVTEALLRLSLGELGVSETMAQWGRARRTH